jgi:hypothetical protein
LWKPPGSRYFYSDFRREGMKHDCRHSGQYPPSCLLFKTVFRKLDSFFFRRSPVLALSIVRGQKIALWDLRISQQWLWRMPSCGI